LRTTLLALSFALFAGGCATRQHVYAPPDNAKVIEATRKVKEGIVKSKEKAHEVKKDLIGATESRDRLIVVSHNLSEQLDAIIAVAPKELIPALDKAKDYSVAGELEQSVLSKFLDSGQGKVDSLEIEIGSAERWQVTLETRQGEYHTEAQSLADTATNERTARIKAEKALSWYRWHWYIGWIVMGLGVIVCGIFAFLKFTGRLALKSAL
jgi:hypothetical protein